MNQTRLSDLDLEIHKGYNIYFEIYLVSFGQRIPLMLVLLLVIGLGTSGAAQSANALMIDFDEIVQNLMKGDIVNNQYQVSNGITIFGKKAPGAGGSPLADIAIIFDSTMFSGNDADLTGPGGAGTCPGGNSGCDGDWDGGNLVAETPPDGTQLNNMLILPETATQQEVDNGNVADPNDEGAQPAGTITIVWDDCVESFGFVIVDQEPGIEVTDGFVQFFDGGTGGTDLGTVQFESFENIGLQGGLFFDASVDYDNNHANRLDPITIADLMTLDNTVVSAGWDTAVINLAGSGAFDDIEYEHCVVGGTGMKIDKASLLLAGDQTLSMWLLPIIISGIGIGLFFVRKN